MIYALWPTENTSVAHHWAMAYRLKTPDLDQGCPARGPYVARDAFWCDPRRKF